MTVGRLVLITVRANDLKNRLHVPQMIHLVQAHISQEKFEIHPQFVSNFIKDSHSY